MSIYFSKTRKNVTIFCNQLNLPPAYVLFFGEEGEKSPRFIASKIAENATSESKIKNIEWNHIHDLSKQLVIKAPNLKL